MLVRPRFILLSLVTILFWTCSTEQALSPEDLVREYAQYINQGKLKEAKSISTPAGIAYLDALSEIIIASATSLDTTEIQIKKIECEQVENGTMRCFSLEFDGFEEYKNEYWLVETEKGWRVDRPATKGEVENSEEILEKE